MTDISSKELRGVPSEPSLIIFNEAAASGFKWSVDDVPGVHVSSVYKAPKSGSFGGSGRREFTLVAANPGTYELNMTYARSGDRVPAKQVTLSFVVKSPAPASR